MQRAASNTPSPDGKTLHPLNKRATMLDDRGVYFGFEQECFFSKDCRTSEWRNQNPQIASDRRRHIAT